MAHTIDTDSLFALTGHRVKMTYDDTGAGRSRYFQHVAGTVRRVDAGGCHTVTVFMEDVTITHHSGESFTLPRRNFSSLHIVDIRSKDSE